MKSFFKKLSLVMALAMVVSMMAPAASAFAADLIIAEQEEKKADAKEEYSVEVGKEVDFKFYGALAGWQDLYKWESSDPEVAKPLENEEGKQDGKFLGLKDGEVEVKLTIGEQEATVKLVVGEGVVEVVDDKSFEIKQTAANKINDTFADAAKATNKVELYKIFNTSSGDVEVAWPCKVAVKDGVATVEAYVDFADGDEYIVKANDVAEGFVAYVGPITNIKVIPMIGDKAATYINQPIKFVVEYYAGDIKVDAPTTGFVYYEVLESTDNVYVDTFNGLSSYIYAVGKSATIKAVYSYNDANLQPATITEEFTIVGFPVPVDAYDTVASYTIAANGTKAEDVKWGTTDLVVGDTNYYVGLNIATTLGNNYSVNAAIKDKAAYTGQFGTISFKSSDESKLLVGSNGYVTAIAPGSAVIIVQLTNTVNNVTTTKNIYAFTVNILPKRQATTVKLSVPSVSVLTADNEGGSLTQAKVTYEVLDQYGAPYAVLDSEGNRVAATVTNTANVPNPAVAVTGDNKGDITVYGTNYATVNLNYVTFEVKAAGVKSYLTVYLTKPSMEGTTVLTNGYLLEATGLDVNVKADKAGVLSAKVTAYTTLNGTKVGYVDGVKVFNYDKFFTENTTGLAKNNIVMKITNPKGELVKDYTVTNGVANIELANVASGAALTPVVTGTYKVELYYVMDAVQNTGSATGCAISPQYLGGTTFEVKNTCAQLSVKEITKDSSTKGNIKEVIVDTVAFQGVDNFTVKASDIVGVTGVFNSYAGKYYVESIDVNVPINDTGCYFKQTIAINKTFTVTFK